MGRRARRAARAPKPARSTLPPVKPVGRGPCPTPSKRRYTPAEAAEQIRTAPERGAPPLDSYLCVCGSVHLTRKKSLEERLRAIRGDGRRQR